MSSVQQNPQTWTTIDQATFHIEKAIKAIRDEIAAAPPFERRNDVRRAEIDQLTDMIDRRRT